MFSGAQFSIYPMTADFMPVIIGSIAALNGLAWLRSQLPDDDRKILRSMLWDRAQDEVMYHRAADRGDASALRFLALMREMVARKERDFAQYTRYILNYELTERRTSYHLNVLSTLLPPPQAELADPEEKP